MKVSFTVPGPSPWQLKSSKSSFETDEGIWKWLYDSSNLSGLSRLISPYDDTVLLLNFYCYAQPLSGNRILIWYEIDIRKIKQNELPRLVFIILQLTELSSINDPEATAISLKQRKEHIYFEGGEPFIFEFPTTQDEGIYNFNVPIQFKDLSEQLVLANCNSRRCSHSMCKAIYAFDFQKSQVTVIPQNWFNEGDYDFEYQWITRVQREIETGLIIGEGVRLGIFRLDRSGTQVREWLYKDDFYHPEYE